MPTVRRAMVRYTSVVNRVTKASREKTGMTSPLNGSVSKNALRNRTTSEPM